MQKIKTKITIIGAGLTGLTLAYLLKKNGIDSTIVEARDRIGGRIFTSRKEGGAPQEMGATWLGKKHLLVTKLLEELGLGIFEQTLGDRAIYEPISTSPPQLVTLPPNDDPSFRIQGGSDQLINALAKSLDAQSLFLSNPVIEINQNENGIAVHTGTHVFHSEYVVSTLPPFLLVEKIKTNPSLPESLLSVARSTHTWMGESIKVGLNYAKPFWRTEKSSGTIFSNVGPIPEMYDHSNYEDNLFGLKGFFNGAYFSVTRAERLKMILAQLEKYFGPVVRDYKSYEEVVWRNEPFTFAPYSQHVLPHQNNGHQIFRATYFNQRFFIAGSETAKNCPGYMDGAVNSAKFVLD